MQTPPKIILGLDPGSHNTGFGVLSFNSGKLKYIDHGVITAPSTFGFLARIELIAGEIAKLVERIAPQITVVEKIFLGKNADSAFKLGHIRGICLIEALKIKSEVIEYAARSVKKGVTGSGASSKEQVQMMLYAALGLKMSSHSTLKIDASDALALAYYHGRTIEFDTRMKQQILRQNISRTKEPL